MQWILDLIQNAGPIFGAADKVVGALLVFFLLIPGEQPDKALRSVASFLSKFSFKGFK